MNRYQAVNPILNVPDEDGISPLHYAVHYRNLSRVRRLEAGALVNQTDNQGMVPLHWGGGVRYCPTRKMGLNSDGVLS